jgi:long-subunit acyl-CoA synthetase (AMP-forming)
MSGIHYITEPEGYLEPKIESNGFGSIEAITVNQRFANSAQKYPSKPAMFLKRPVDGKVPDDWKVWTWSEYYADCKKFAKTLVSLDIRTFKIINILGFNSVSIMYTQILLSI